MAPAEPLSVVHSPSPHPHQQQVSPDGLLLALDLSLQQLSVYASQRRLCITAALVKAFQEVETGLRMLTRPPAASLSVDVAPAAKVCSSQPPCASCIVTGCLATYCRLDDRLELHHTCGPVMEWCHTQHGVQQFVPSHKHCTARTDV